MRDRFVYALLAVLTISSMPALAQPEGSAPPTAMPASDGGTIVSTDITSWDAPPAFTDKSCDIDCPKNGYITAEYLLWWLKNGQLRSPLIAGGGPGSTGIVGSSGTTVLVGDESLSSNPYSGARLRGGWWFGCANQIGLELGGFVVTDGEELNSFRSVVSPTAVLSRPFVNALNGANQSLLIAAPGVANGGAQVESFTNFFGAEANVVLNAYRSSCCRLDVFSGYRHLNLQEEVKVTQSAQTTSPGATFGGVALPVGSTVTVLDQSTTRNNFQGGTLGFRFTGQPCCRVFTEATVRCAFGNIRQAVELVGYTGAAGPGGSVGTLPGGLLVGTSNAGRLTDQDFAVAPEVACKVGISITPKIVVFAGYDFVYLSRVVRAGDQFDARVNPALLPTSSTFSPSTPPALPAQLFDTTDFWAQGLSVGLTYRY